MTTTLHRLTAADVQYTDHEDTLLRRFNSATEDHQLTVLHDDGLYRHLRFKNPENGFYWFDLITWPGNLTITGDMGTWTFRRIEDMFDFFTGHINTDYWAEKLQHGETGGRGTARKYDADLFKKWLVQDFWETSRDLDNKLATAWWRELVSDVLGDYAISDYSTTEAALDTLRNLFLPKVLDTQYQDVWEAVEGWEQYTSHFEWCLAAIVTGIRTYNTHKQTEREAQEPTK